MIDWIVILIPIVAFWFTNITGIPQGVKRAWNKSKLRPMDCPKCMAFWIALSYQIPYFNKYSIVIICLSSLAAYLIEVLAEKLKLPINR